MLQEKVTTNGTTETHNFFYDNTGKPYAMQINGTTYYYVTNLQGDVMGLVDTSGNSVASYTYDPYGKVLTATGTLAEKNPLRYRGYYYDSESGLYYLQSRYYDPATRRFVNADSYASTNQSIISYNMFAYCKNCPVFSVDVYGDDSRLVGLGAELELDMGIITTGIEVIVYWDKTVCNGDEPIVEVYVYAGVSVDLTELAKNPEYQRLVSQLGLALTQADPSCFGAEELQILWQSICTGSSASLSLVAVFGNEDFTSTKDYEGWFTTRSVSFKHVKVGYAYSNTGFTITVGATSSATLNISMGQTYYVLLQE